MSMATSEMQRSLFDVKDYVVCVTGASSGLGRATAKILADRGAHVVGIARSKDELEAWQNSCDAETASVAADLCKREDLPRIIEEVTGAFGAPDILINAAGVNMRRPADIVTQEEWDQTIELNLNAPFFLAQALVPAMKDKKWGRIINFASLQSRRAFPDGIAYGATKGGIEQLTRAMAEAWSRHGILSNALAPGFFPTKLTEPIFSKQNLAEEQSQRTCIGRNGTIEDLEGPLLFLCSSASNYITGQTIFVDGGYSAK